MAIYTRKEAPQAMNHDEGSYQLTDMTAFLARQVCVVSRTGRTSN